MSSLADLAQAGERLWIATLRNERDWSLLLVEFEVYAARDAVLRQRLAGILGQLRAAMCETIEAVAGASGERLPVPAEQLTVATLALSNGIMLEGLDGCDLEHSRSISSGLRAVSARCGSAGRHLVSGGSVVRRLGDAAGAMRHYRRLTSVGTTREELLALQRRRLVATARHAAAASPLYRELYAGIELEEDLNVRSLPIVSKAMLMDHFEESVTDPRLRLSEVEAHLEKVHGDELYLDCYRCMPTGGTTGRKGVFVYDRDEWRQCLTAFLRWTELTGLRPRLGRRVRLATVTATSGSSVKFAGG